MEEKDRLIDQLCYDLQLAHNEICSLQNIENPENYTFPVWSSPFNTLRWAEELMGKSYKKKDIL